MLESSAGVPCEFYDIFKNAYFAEHLQTTASDYDNTENFGDLKTIGINDNEHSNYEHLTNST